MKKNIFLFLISFSLAFGTGEVVIRSLVTYDTDGNGWISGRMLKSYKLPVNEVSKNLERQIRAKETIFIYDSILGWTLRPDYMGANSMGLRSAHREYSLHPSEDTLRIALFGDSYIYGSEVPYDSTIGAQLEKILLAKGIKAEVLNFGVGAYGMDQAFLRWKHFGKKFSPHIVVFGFQPENIYRNVNLVRALYSRKEAFPFMKPRFILSGDSLALINVPVPPPDSLPGILANFSGFTLAANEGYYNNSDFEQGILFKSRFISYIENFLGENRFNIRSNEIYFFSAGKAPAKLAAKITDVFREDVEKSGAKFFTVLLPRREDCIAAAGGNDLTCEAILTIVGKSIRLLRPEKEFARIANEGNINALYRPAFHISGTGNRIIAENISGSITK
jgi:hypothetical protein